MEKEKYTAPSVDYAAKILIYLSRYKTKHSTLTEISKDLGISKTTCLRVLKTLEKHNFIYYDIEKRKYSLGIYASVLGYRANENLDYLKIIKPYLQEASERTGFTSALIQRISKNRMMFVSQVITDKYPKLTISVGNKFPLTEVSFGKWILANVNEIERDLFLSKGLKKKTTKTITNVQDYIHQLHEIKKTKILVSREEYTDGVLAISSPVYDGRGSIIAVLAIIGLSRVTSKKREQELCEILKDVSAKCNNQTNSLIIEGLDFK